MDAMPAPVTSAGDVAALIDETFLAFNAGRLREACALYASLLAEDTLVGVSLAGALTPAGLGVSCIVPLIRAGFVDWIVATGANLYHDAHRPLGQHLTVRGPHQDDVALHAEGMIRIYDLVLPYRDLLSTDEFFRAMLARPEFARTMGTAEFHHAAGAYMRRREQALTGADDATLSVLAAAWEESVPVFTPSPGDSSIGMNAAALALAGGGFRFDPQRDVNASASLVWAAKRAGSRSAVIVFGGGAPKNFMLQTEPHLQEILGLPEYGHDFFVQVTDARPDTGGLSGATPSEAVSWRKIDPEALDRTVTCYTDSTIALPLMTAYVLARAARREPKRLFDRLPEFLDGMTQEAIEAGTLSPRSDSRVDG